MRACKRLSRAFYSRETEQKLRWRNNNNDGSSQQPTAKSGSDNGRISTFARFTHYIHRFCGWSVLVMRKSCKSTPSTLSAAPRCTRCVRCADTSIRRTEYTQELRYCNTHDNALFWTRGDREDTQPYTAMSECVLYTNLARLRSPSYMLPPFLLVVWCSFALIREHGLSHIWT